MKRRTLFGTGLLSIVGIGSATDIANREMSVDDLYAGLPKDNGKKIKIAVYNYPARYDEHWKYESGEFAIYRVELVKHNRVWIAYVVDPYNGISYSEYENALKYAGNFANQEQYEYGGLYSSTTMFISPVHHMSENMYPNWIEQLNEKRIFNA